jgi:hypothetical protein
MSQPFIHIPRPCAVSQEALAPTAAGWHCARCQTEVIDFTRLSEAEILAYLAERSGQRVCAAMQVPLVPQHCKRPKGVRRWLLAVAAFLGWQSAEALPPQLPPSQSSFFKAAVDNERITIRGVVLDDSLHVPIQGAYIFINGTKYGAVTNEKGEFSFTFSPDWPPAQKGEFLLEVSAGHFTFERQLVVVSFKDNAAPTPLPITVRLLSRPQRGFIRGKVKFTPVPVAPPSVQQSRP